MPRSIKHLLEALINDNDGVAGQILRQLGRVDQLRNALDHYWSSPGKGSLLMIDFPPDPDGEAYQVLLAFDRPGGPARLQLDTQGQVQVIRRASLADQRIEPAPPNDQSRTDLSDNKGLGPTLPTAQAGSVVNSE